MMKRTIKQISKMIRIENDITSFEDTLINGACIDTRVIEEGNLYVPLKGRFSDGHLFVETAIQNGAAAAFWQMDVPNPPEDLPILIVEDVLTALQELAKAYLNELDVKVVGITGSNGKTTTKDMVASVLSQKYKVQKTIGNFNGKQGLPLTVLSLNEDTEIAVLEMGMSAKGEIEFLTKLARPDVTIITNIGEAHLQDLGSRGAIADAKMEIVQGLSPDGLFIYMGDEPLLKERIQAYPNIRRKTFGASNENDIYPMNVKQEEFGSAYSTNIAPELSLFIPVLGEYNVLNSLAAIMTGLEFGLSLNEIKEGLSSMQLTAMRMEMLSGMKGVKILNDAYNASPTSMKAALNLVMDLEQTKSKIVVLGDMLELGKDEIEFHREIGRFLQPSKIQYVYTYGELGYYIAEEATKQFGSERVFSYLDKQKLTNALLSVIRGNELILVKASRGMKLEDVVDSLMEK
ncbi:UDP-N-acetylmuramoyl-tripeptide--D-alanyl-D-alanine ligase [Bacillus sp. FJAT-49736]|uniref:UDP-N-acetylmuramoyl-tripeptide--D-alanyl-D- alanine ligase n=1 Tax=Bacillus sp. FJAT-49736 TaxID=2833582 RepID=UPI001BC91D6C|nr:UDP-N-acetylmuramoyl-tripeptide--D-alanyl-D-alanine ligase [Bacillus sp. FJAT-49736]MBS4175470.1 UDP-N-acetylmuramoyl-tripeptide--D-alanyl-D-alanine ligase [Bacillus sp. FJAT-49736]